MTTHRASHWTFRTPAYRALDLTFDVATTDAALGAYLAHVLASFPEADKTQPVAHFGLASEGWISRNGRVVARVSRTTAAGELFRLLNRAVVHASRRRLLLVHAALVQLDGAGLMILGPSGSGKSTLTTALVAHGAAYGTDEIVALDVATGTMEWLARPIVLKTRRVGAPEVPGPPPPPEVRQWFRAQRPLALSDVGSPAVPAVPIERLVFPEVRRGAPNDLEPIRRAEALTRVIDSCFNLRFHGRPALGMLAQLVARARPETAQMSDADVMARLVMDDDHGDRA